MQMLPKTFCAALLALSPLTLPAELDWSSDFAKSQKKAAKEDKLMLVNFTGSDWCGWCIRLDEEVFSQEEFASAGEKYIPVVVDLPQDQSILEEGQFEKNQALKDKYSVPGFPTILLVNGKGKPIARTGYLEGGPEAYLKELEAITKPYTEFKAAEGEEREAALFAFLKNLQPEHAETFYEEELAELAKSDSEEVQAFLAELETSRKLAALQEEMDNSMMAGEFDEAISQIDSYIAKEKPEGEMKQNILMGKVQAHVAKGDKEAAFLELDSIAALAPETELAKNVDEIKASISSFLETRKVMEEEAEEAVNEEEAEPKAEEEPIPAE